MTKQEILLAQKEFLFPAVFHYFKEPLVVSHAKDQYVWGVDGNQYLDFFGGIVTVSVGHCNETVNRNPGKMHDGSALDGLPRSWFAGLRSRCESMFSPVQVSDHF